MLLGINQFNPFCKQRGLVKAIFSLKSVEYDDDDDDPPMYRKKRANIMDYQLMKLWNGVMMNWRCIIDTKIIYCILAHLVIKSHDIRSHNLFFKFILGKSYSALYPF